MVSRIKAWWRRRRAKRAGAEPPVSMLRDGEPIEPHGFLDMDFCAGCDAAFRDHIIRFALVHWVQRKFRSACERRRRKAC
jgi:hypothetical protein